MGYIEKENLTPEELKKLKKQDSYGFKKLLAETLLFKTHPRVLSLRLADVIGSFDETFRLWRLVLWAMHSSEIYPLQLDDRAMSHKLCFTASKDVVAVILSALHDPKTGIYNLACQEKLTLEAFLKLLVSVLDISDARFRTKHPARKIFPSVDCGPIDITQAREHLGFVPSDLVSAG